MPNPSVIVSAALVAAAVLVDVLAVKAELRVPLPCRQTRPGGWRFLDLTDRDRQS